MVAGGDQTVRVSAEFGTVNNKADAEALFAMDAYQHVKPNAPYPAVLLFAGMWRSGGPERWRWTASCCASCSARRSCAT